MIKVVSIPRIAAHAGSPFNLIHVRLYWVCPQCGDERGELVGTTSYDGSCRLYCDGWSNPCGHVDKYSAVKKEALANGLNEEVTA
ncbi:hypothetical protein [Grimontia marina]|uniref:Uncharacterized protein n=1 Tax=Grimontia marina TaxID=646534 RepID=A0A128F8T4_9GAMM|nr:hypothetical protein [Grimontia marina]CZF83158.1 hypothetical protein GMA8713_02504 [Grimontia marina]